MQSIISLLETIIKHGKPLFIIAEDVEGEVLTKLMLQDIAILTKANVIDEASGIKLENISIDMLGSAKKIVISKENTLIVDGIGDKKEIEDRANHIRNEIKESDSDYDKEKLQERLAKLVGGVAVLKIGGSTEVEVKEKKDRVEDALSATRAAVEDGIVPGGGVTLLYTSKMLDNLKTDNEDQQSGVEILKQALTEPLRQIAKNCGKEGAIVVNDLLNMNDSTKGFDAQNMCYTNMLQAGIIDPVKVVK